MHALILAAAASGFTALCTAAGALGVYAVRRPGSPLAMQLSLGFAAGVMIAAAIYGLLEPAMAMTGTWHRAAAGFVLGVAFLLALDKAMPHLHTLAGSPEGPAVPLSRSALLFLAVTIHNVPEGMALGTAAAAAQGADTGSLAALALGIGIQNVPEGAAVALPYLAEGASRRRAAALGVLSGLVEPAAALAMAAFASAAAAALPVLLSFAAGAMMYVVFEELIPRTHSGGDAQTVDMGTIALLSGFLLMTVLEQALG